MMKLLNIYSFLAFVLLSAISLNAQDRVDERQLKQTIEEANDYVYQANEQLKEEDYVEAEMSYRKAISKQPSNVVGAYNLGNTYYKSGNFEEALFRHQEAAKEATNKVEKHRAFHNIGNVLMQNKKCQEAVEAYKNALRNDPTDDETRYNLVLAKECAEQQKDQNQNDENEDENKDKQDQNQDQDKKEDEGDKKDDPKDQGEDDNKQGEDQKDEEGKPKDEKKDENKQGDQQKDQKQQPKPQPGQLSPQQIKSLLEAMNNQEQKVQEKINAEKQKGVKVKTEKDW